MNETISIHATLKKAGGRPAREPGDKPIFELVLRSEVNAETSAIMAKLGKDFEVRLEPVPDAQGKLFDEAMGGRVTTVDQNSIVLESIAVDGDSEEHTNGQEHVEVNAGRRRRGTRATVLEE